MGMNESYIKPDKLAYPPDVVLAKLIVKKLGFKIYPDEVRLFVLENWDMLSLLAHKIHNQKKNVP